MAGKQSSMIAVFDMCCVVWTMVSSISKTSIICTRGKNESTMDSSLINELTRQILTYIKNYVIDETVPVIDIIYAEHMGDSDSITDLVKDAMSIKIDEMLAAIPKLTPPASQPVQVVQVPPRPVAAAPVAYQVAAPVQQQQPLTVAAPAVKTLCMAKTIKGQCCKNMGKHYNMDGSWVCHAHWDSKSTGVVAHVATVPAPGMPAMTAPNANIRPTVPQKSASSFATIISAQRIAPTTAPADTFASAVNLNDIDVNDTTI